MMTRWWMNKTLWIGTGCLIAVLITVRTSASVLPEAGTILVGDITENTYVMVAVDPATGRRAPLETVDHNIYVVDQDTILLRACFNGAEFCVLTEIVLPIALLESWQRLYNSWQFEEDTLIAIAPDKTRVLLQGINYETAQTIYEIIDVATLGRTSIELPYNTVNPYAVADWHSNGIVVPCDSTSICLIDETTLEFTKVDLPISNLDTISRLLWSPDGQYIAVAVGTGHFLLIDSRTLTLEDWFSAGGSSSWTSTWSPDSQYLAYNQNRGLWIIAVGEHEPTQLITPPEFMDFNFVWSPDSSRIAVQSYHVDSCETLEVIEVISTERLPLSQLGWCGDEGQRSLHWLPSVN